MQVQRCRKRPFSLTDSLKFLSFLLATNRRIFPTVCSNLFSGVACAFCFCIGLIFTTGAGEYWLSLFDKYGAMGLTLIAFSELISVMYVYGHER